MNFEYIKKMNSNFFIEIFFSIFFLHHFQDSNFSMLIVLPNEATGLPLLEERLAGKSIASLLEDGFESKITVKLPKFKLDFEADLKENLRTVCSII